MLKAKRKKKKKNKQTNKQTNNIKTQVGGEWVDG